MVTVRCVPADLVRDKYAVDVAVGDVYQPVDNWWLLITADSTSDLVRPNDLKICLESLRTLTSIDQALSFQIFDFYRGKFKFREWIELIALDILGTIMRTDIGP